MCQYSTTIQSNTSIWFSFKFHCQILTKMNISFFIHTKYVYKIIKKKVHKKLKLQQKIHCPETTRSPTVSVSLAVPSQHLNYSLGHGVSQHEGWTCILDGLEGLTIHPWTIVARLNPKTVNVEVFEHQGQSIGNLCDRAPSNHGSKESRWARIAG